MRIQLPLDILVCVRGLCAERRQSSQSRLSRQSRQTDEQLTEAVWMMIGESVGGLEAASRGEGDGRDGSRW